MAVFSHYDRRKCQKAGQEGLFPAPAFASPVSPDGGHTAREHPKFPQRSHIMSSDTLAKSLRPVSLLVVLPGISLIFADWLIQSALFL